MLNSSQTHLTKSLDSMSIGNHTSHQCSLCGSSPKPSNAACTMDNYTINNTRKGQKRQKNCMAKCRRRTRADEAHWTKVLQTSHNSLHPNHQSPPPLVTPPISPIQALGQSVSRFFKWISPGKRYSSKSCTEDNMRSMSVSSEDSGLCPESPRPSDLSTSPGIAAIRPNNLPHGSYDAKTLLQAPSSSTLLTKRVLERQHQVHKPTPQPQTASPSSTTSNKLTTVASAPNTTLLQVPGPSISNEKYQELPTHNNSAPTLGELTVQLSPTLRSPLTATRSCPSSQKSLRSMSSTKDQLASTWPLTGQHIAYVESDDEDVFTDYPDDVSINLYKNVEEFTIPHENIMLDELVGDWTYGKVYTGKWHGSATIQLYNSQADPQVKDIFWEEARKMSRVRHENIALFLGACTEPDHLALVTSICTGVSVYEKLHIVREKMPLSVRLALSYQVTQALAYLHAKHIVYKHLNAYNVFIDKHKATLSAIDFTDVKKGMKQERDKSKLQLPYLAPELLTYLIGTKPTESHKLPYTTQTDIYALGILLYELISASKPFESIPKDALILQISSGRRPIVEKLTAPQTLKTVIESCWAHLSHYRPHAQEILNELLKKDVSLHNRFSSSEPDNLNKIKTLF